MLPQAACIGCRNVRWNELTTGINYERMPVVLFNPDDFQTWLSGSTEEAFKLAGSNAAAPGAH
jgi:hypothetical protein